MKLLSTKKIVVMGFAVFCMTLLQTLHAQNYNKMYPHTSGAFALELHSIDVISDGAGNTIHLVSGNNNEIGLTKLDFYGNVIWDKINDISTSVNIQSLRPFKIIQTNNNSIIAVGFVTTNAGAKNPFAARFSSTGSFLNMKIYSSNTGWSWSQFLGGGFERVNIARMQGVLGEQYLITAPGSSPLPTSYVPGTVIPYTDIVINAIRIDGTSLKDRWNKKYFVPDTLYRNILKSGHPTYTGYDIIVHRDHPYGLVHVNDAGANKYIITGTTTQFLQSGTSTISNNNFISMMSIDNSGNIVDGYRGVYAGKYPGNQNMLWDQATNEVIMSYTIGVTNAAATAVPGPASSTPQDVVGVMRIKPSNIGVINTTSDFYYFVNAKENTAHGIIENISGTGYVIPVSTYDYITQPGNPLYNIGMLDIEKSPSSINNLYLYNKFSATSAAAITYNKFGVFENYVIAGNKKPYPSSLNTPRSTSIDIVGSACGQFSLPFGQGIFNHKYEDVQSYEKFVSHKFGEYISDELYTLNTSVIPDDCDAVGNNPPYWKPTVVNDINLENAITIYPSIVSGNEKINIDVSTIKNTEITIRLFSVDGRKIDEIYYQLNKGANRIKWQTDFPYAGNYIIQTTSPELTLQKSMRITQIR